MYSYQNYDSDYDRPIPQSQRSPLTKQVNQLYYEIPRSKYASPWSCAPEFIKIFGDATVPEGGKVIFDAVLLGTPRPRVTWLFNDRKLPFTDADLTDTSDVCRLQINRVRPEHYGHYMVVAENEIGRATASAVLQRPY